MLQNLHIKNFALIEETEISFEQGLHILSGETGAGKSILLGALKLALGEKVSKEMIRQEEQEALIEAVFLITNETQKQRLEQSDIEVYDDQVILTRKITGTRSVARINGETVPAQKLKEVGDIFLDIYGQHQYQSLLRTGKQKDLLDEYGKIEIYPLKEKVKSHYDTYTKIQKELEQSVKEEGELAREISFLQHEIQEIAQANLSEEEEQLLEEEFKKASNVQKIQEALEGLKTTFSGQQGVCEEIGRGSKELHSVCCYDADLEGLSQQLLELEDCMNSFQRDLFHYLDRLDFRPEDLDQMNQRLTLIHDLKRKYGASIQEVLEAKAEKEKRLEQLLSYDKYLEDLKNDLIKEEQQLSAHCEQLTKVREKYAKELSELVEHALLDLNFLDVSFEIRLEPSDKYRGDGVDEVEFFIVTNPGEPKKPLRMVASGGEMSRIMLALKTVMAQNDMIDTLVFDEIDSGISGRTAQAVSEKLSLVAKNHQVICITHLPQIAAMADCHYLIEKEVKNGTTISKIQPLTEEASIVELARMLGGNEITAAVMENAKELRQQAKDLK